MERTLIMMRLVIMTLLLICILCQVCPAMVDETKVLPGEMQEPVVIDYPVKNKKIILPPGLAGYKLVQKGGNIPEGLNVSDDANSVIVVSNGTGNNNTQADNNLPPELQNALQGNNSGNNNMSSDPNQTQLISQKDLNKPDNRQNINQDNTGKFLIFIFVTLFVLLAILLIYLFNKNKLSTN